MVTHIFGQEKCRIPKFWYSKFSANPYFEDLNFTVHTHTPVYKYRERPHRHPHNHLNISEITLRTNYSPKMVAPLYITGCREKIHSVSAVVMFCFPLCFQIHGSQSPIRLLRVSHCAIFFNMVQPIDPIFCKMIEIIE